jgi:phenylalanyl-tRNA synthetase beta chain
MVNAGIVAGEVIKVQPHPNAERIRLAYVDVGGGRMPMQIVFGGPPIVVAGSLVAVAPPGARVCAKAKKMRRRNYRGESSYGMLCSSAELGWDPDGPDEVALLDGVRPGTPLDDYGPDTWRSIAAGELVAGVRELPAGQGDLAAAAS